MRNFSLELGQMKVFMEVAKDCNMTRAASVLGLTQPAVSSIIKRIETGLGMALFDRDVRPMKLTLEGTVLYNRGGSVIEMMDSIVADMYRTAKGKNPDLRLGCSEAIMSNFGASLITSLNRHVGHLTVLGGSTPQVAGRLKSNEINIALSSDLLEREQGVRSIPLFREDFLLTVNRDICKKLNPRNWVDLRHYLETTPYVRTGMDTMDYFQTERVLRSMELRRLTTMEVDSCIAHLGVVAKGAAWSIIPVLAAIVASKHLGNVSFLDFGNRSATRSFFLTYRESTFKPLAQLISDEMKVVFEQEVSPEIRELKPELGQHIYWIQQ